ncbi:MAG TPA: sigma-70 family RNA polymerase sigma factor [Opitutus sp.]|nr:sigma-70 family RNA polymerase sigma factor [Opitutus sp.]
MVPPDSELIALARAGLDRTAFGELVRRHQSAVRGFLRHLIRDDDALADDLAQETFLAAFRRLDHFRADSRFSTWLLGIAHNQWRNARRRRRDHAELSEHIPAESDPAAPAAADLHHDLTAALATLSADEQLAIHLGYHQGLSHAEIAALVDWPLGTVKTHLARSKEKLRHLLAAWNPRA